MTIGGSTVAALGGMTTTGASLVEIFLFKDLQKKLKMLSIRIMHRLKRSRKNSNSLTGSVRRLRRGKK